MQHFLRIVSTQVRELYFGDFFLKNLFRFGLRSDVHELISFKLGMMMIDITKLYILIPCE